MLGQVYLAQLCPRAFSHLHLKVAGGIVAKAIDGGVLGDVGEVLVAHAAAGGHGLSLLQDVGIEVLYALNTRLGQGELANLLRALVDDSLVHANGAIAGGAAVHGIVVFHVLFQ